LAKKHVAFILDRSGSMGSIWDEVQGGYKHFVEEQQKQGDIKFSLTAFDNYIDKVIDGKPISEVSSKLPESVVPRGTTALLDAVGKTINAIGKNKKQVMVVIFTDGYENASHEFTKAQVKSLIEERRAAGWGFAFLGADQDAFAEGAQFGMVRGSTMSFQSGVKGSSLGSIAAASSATMGYFATGDVSLPEEYKPDTETKTVTPTP
jgi:Mg-chelatase subunit ChlD